MHMKANKVLTFVLAVIVFGSCKDREVEILLKKSKVDSLVVSFRRMGNDDTSFFVKDRQYIEELFDEFLSESSESFGKFPIKYYVILCSEGAALDTVYFNDVNYRSSETGTRKMKNNIHLFFEKISRGN